MTEMNGATAPSPGTFDLPAFVADKITYARYKSTIHLAAEEARRSVELSDEHAQLLNQRASLHRQAKETKTQVSLGEVAPTTSRIEQIEDRIAEIEAERSELAKVVKDSALTFYFSVTGRDVQARISEQVTKLINGDDEEQVDLADENAVAERVNNRMKRDANSVTKQTAIMMHELTTQIVNSRGEEYPIDKLTKETLEGLLNAVPIGEIARINETMALAMNSAQDFDRAMDAGFPR